MDILKYQPVIKDVMAKLKVRKNQQEDMTQECYLALLAGEDKLKAADDDMGYAATICRNRIRQCWSKERFGIPNFNQIKDDPPKIRFDSLSEPKIQRKAARIASLSPAPDAGLLFMDMRAAVSGLSEEEQDVVQRILGGENREQIAAALGVSRRAVGRRYEAAVEKLKKVLGA